ncbi:cytochrome P450 [Nocardia sp. NPDC057227]|uniref:cytochrome P450 n=1 Tax=Nocardia sp. NPDC057227 TaxID=3346056 RepID=UPI003638AE2D
MSLNQDFAPPGCPVLQHPGPIGLNGPVFALHSSEYARDPHAVYAEMRRYDPDFARVELAPGVPATLVIGWEWAVRILYDAERFRADPGGWVDTVSGSCPVRPMMEPRRNALRTDGFDHGRYRRATKAALGVVDLHRLHEVVAGHARELVEAVAERGRMDVVADYAGPLALSTINSMMGCPPELGVELARGLAAMFDAEADPRRVNGVLDGSLGALIDLRRAEPGDDVPTALMRHAPDMGRRELREQLLTMYAAALEPLQHLVVNTVLLLLTDRRFGDALVSHSCTAEEALHEVLFRDSPLANLCVRYPVQPIPIDGLIAPGGRAGPVHGITLPAGQPVLIGMAACNTDPRITRAPDASGRIDYSHNTAHLAFAAGPHACPARDLAIQVAIDAVEELLDRLPELRLACPVGKLVWRPGPFHRALEALPVAWTPRR